MSLIYSSVLLEFLCLLQSMSLSYYLSLEYLPLSVDQGEPM
jgi:threonine/homoserine efflux transporter RhtA